MDAVIVCPLASLWSASAPLLLLAPSSLSPWTLHTARLQADGSHEQSACACCQAIYMCLLSCNLHVPVAKQSACRTPGRIYMHVYCTQYGVHRLIPCIFEPSSAFCNVHSDTSSGSCVCVKLKVLHDFIANSKHDGSIVHYCFEPIGCSAVKGWSKFGYSCHHSSWETQKGKMKQKLWSSPYWLSIIAGFDKY